HVDQPLAPAVSPPLPTEIDIKIAEHVAELIDNGATLQFGVGGVVNAVLERLDGHRDLGVHSGGGSEGIMPLMQKGIINNSQKTLFPGKTVIGMLHGSQKLLDFLHYNSDVLMVGATVTHGL